MKAASDSTDEVDLDAFDYREYLRKEAIAQAWEQECVQHFYFYKGSAHKTSPHSSNASSVTVMQKTHITPVDELWIRDKRGELCLYSGDPDLVELEYLEYCRQEALWERLSHHDPPT